MPRGVYRKSGICIRNHCGAEPPRDIEPAGLVTTVGGRDRASTAYAAADRVKTPASATRGRFRRIHGGRTAPSLPTETWTTSGVGCLAGSVPSVLVRSRRCSRTPPRPHGSVNTNEKEDKGEHDAAQNANVTTEKRNEDQTDQRVRRRPGKGPALLYRSAGLREKGRLQPGAVSLAHGGLIRGPGWHGVAAGAQQQPGGQNLPAGQVPARPARGHVLHRRRAGRLRAYESARRRVHHATKGCDGIQDRHVERHLRQSHSGHAADALVDGRKAEDR